MADDPDRARKAEDERIQLLVEQTARLLRQLDEIERRLDRLDAVIRRRLDA